MTGLPSMPPLPFRTMIRDKKAGLELGRTNFSAFGLRSLIALGLLITMVVVALEILL